MTSADPGPLDRRATERLALLDEALEAVDALLGALTRQGLQRLTASSEAEIRATAQRAHFGGMIRVERQLEALATLAERYRSRDPLFRPSQYAASLNRAWLLARAVRAARRGGEVPVALLGEARRSYAPVVGPLEVKALAAVGWVTDTDFVGITVHVAAGDRLLQVSNAKPCLYFGREPSRLLWQPLTDQVPLAVAELSHGAFTLHNARLSADGRLSLHRELEVEPAPDPGLDGYGPWRVGAWSEIIERLRHQAVDPVGGAGAALVLVEPAQWGPVQVDDTGARARQALTDAAGATLWVDVPLAPHTALLVANLQSLRASRGPRADALVGHARVVGGRLCLEPHTAVFYDGVELKGRPSRHVYELHLTVEDLAWARR